jgi:hypothetical protein
MIRRETFSIRRKICRAFFQLAMALGIASYCSRTIATDKYETV